MSDLFFAVDDLCCGSDGDGRDGFDSLSFLSSRAPVPFLSFTFWRCGIPLLPEGLSLLLLSMCFEDAVEPDDECPCLGLGLVEVVTTVSLEEVLPKRRDNWSNVLIVSDRDAFDSSMRDS